MTNYEMTREDCVKMVRGMKRMPDSPAHFSVYCCNDTSICIKMDISKFIVYYNVRKEFVEREDLLPVAFENELTFNIIK